MDIEAEDMEEPPPPHHSTFIDGYPIDAMDSIVGDVKPTAVSAAVHEIYRRSAGGYIWNDGRRLTTAARRLVWLLETVREHGIEPRLLDARGTLTLIDSLVWVRSLIEASDATASDYTSLIELRGLLLSRLDVRLTGCALMLARLFGHTEAGGIELASVLPGSDALDDWVYGLLPWFPQYHRLSDALDRYRRMARWTVVKAPGRRRIQEGSRVRFEDISWKLGDEHDDLILVRERLAQEEFLLTGHLYNPIFDAELEAAVSAFQYSRGLGVNGVVDNETANALNVPRRQLISDIRDAMTYWRSAKIRSERTFLVVNIPEFTVELYADRRRLRRSKAVVGYAYGSGGGRTKLFHSSIRRVVINPGWTPSNRLIENELKPKEQSNPGWLKRRGFQWFKRKDGRIGLFQQPGEKNALGRVKLSFPNDYNIYLHGSPNEEQFDLANRAQSNGCVRVEQAEAIAHDILLISGTLQRGEFEAAIRDGRTKVLRLQNAVPVHFEYVRVVVDDDETVRFLPNVYQL
ncbi:MAG: L,D-transpeptidase family protein [Myxococcota bacterium]|nr:L,D-transpeptidase family protein [Myxococcota bacterium]